jgi:tetratricopeptide (TPR) repeat protein
MKTLCWLFAFMAFFRCAGVPKSDSAVSTLWYGDREINFVIMTAWDHFASQRYDQALHDFERLIVKGYDHYDVLFGAALSCLKKNDRTKALKYFSQSLSRREDHFDSLYFRGELYLSMNDREHARADLEAVTHCMTRSPIICGLYPSRKADSSAFEKRRVAALEILGKL